MNNLNIMRGCITNSIQKISKKNIFEAYFSKFPFFFNFEFWNVFLPLPEGTEGALESNPKKKGTNEPSKEYSTGKPRHTTII